MSAVCLLEPRVLAKEISMTLRENPRFHDQSRWVRGRCGTAQCIAGWAVELSGFVTTGSAHGYVLLEDIPQEVTDWMSAHGLAGIPTASGEGVPTRFLAQALLKLDNYQANTLFYAVTREKALDILDEMFDLC